MTQICTVPPSPLTSETDKAAGIPGQAQEDRPTGLCSHDDGSCALCLSAPTRFPRILAILITSAPFQTALSFFNPFWLRRPAVNPILCHFSTLGVHAVFPAIPYSYTMGMFKNFIEPGGLSYPRLSCLEYTDTDIMPC